jgi:hypothetical protein
MVSMFVPDFAFGSIRATLAVTVIVIVRWIGGMRCATPPYGLYRAYAYLARQQPVGTCPSAPFDFVRVQNLKAFCQSVVVHEYYKVVAAPSSRWRDQSVNA